MYRWEDMLDSNDRRIVRLTLTKAGEDKLAQLASAHLEELQRLATLIHAVVDPATPEHTL